jgi:hypothetical protein
MKELTKEIKDDYQQPERAISNYITEVAAELAEVEDINQNIDALDMLCQTFENVTHHLREGILSE